MLKTNHKWLVLLLTASLLMALLAGCGTGATSEETTFSETGDLSPDNQNNQETDGSDPETEGTQAPRPSFNYSEGLAKSGYWSGIQALSHVELLNYSSIDFPDEVAYVSEDQLEAEISSLLQYYAFDESITDRPVSDGDTVNIDFDGSLDGEPFEGGSTGGNGTNVTLGVTAYIDGFLEQLIGKMPGETFDIEVTFPDDYGVEELDGQEAVFTITIHRIVATIVPDLDDTFVAEYLSDEYGWTTAQEVRTALRSDLRSMAVESFLSEFLVEQTTIISIPEALITYQEQLMLNSYKDFADQYGVSFDDFLAEYLEIETIEEVFADNREHNEKTASLHLIVQAIAEDAGITVSEEDVGQYFKRYMGLDDYSEYTGIYGLPYLQMIILKYTVFDYLADLNI